MKNYDETINTVFKKIDQYNIIHKHKRKVILRTLVPTLCVCLAVGIGTFVWQGNVLKNEPAVTLNDSTVIGEKDYTESSDEQPDIMQIPGANNTPDIIGLVKVGGIQYLQCDIDHSLFTADEHLGDARDFEGTYKQVSDKFPDITTELYTVKESPNVMMIKLGNGGTVILGRVGEIIVDGKTYFSTQWVADELTIDKYLGNAGDYELIEVPHRESYIVPEDEIWTVQENSDILFVKKSNGDILIYSIWE